MRQTLDQLYADVMSLTSRITSGFERNDYQQLSKMAYINEDVRKLSQFKRILSNLKPTVMTEPSVKLPKQVSLKPNEEASGMNNPRVYQYYTNFNSPLNNQVMQLAPSFPLYSNFGAYNKALN
jgi:hypothetical protein